MKISVSTIGFLCLVCLLFCACDDDQAVCGNGVIENGEDCDGQAMPATTCVDLGFVGGTPGCTDCALVSDGCHKCGNSEIDSGEECDGQNLDQKTCADLERVGGDLGCTGECAFDQSACHDWPPLTIVTNDLASETPLEGVTVALDAPSGERFEQLTDTEGKTTFSDIDWTAGSTTVTVHLDGYTMVTFAAFDASAIENDMLINLWSLTAPQPESVTLSGTFTGVMDLAHGCTINVVRSPVASEWQGAGDVTWGVRVPRGLPFTLQGLETEVAYLPSGQGYSMAVHQVAHQDYPALDVNTSGEVLDFVANAVATHTQDVFISLPPRADSPLRTGFPVCLVAEAQSLYTIGWSTLLDISADGNQFDASLLWTQPAWAEGVRTFCRVSNQQGLGSSTAYTDGYPQPGELDPLLDVPKWIAPANPTMAHPLHDPLVWDLFDPGVSVQINITRGGQQIWGVITGEDAETVTIPALPSSLDPATFLGTEPLPTYTYAAFAPEPSEPIKAYSTAQVILLAP